MITLSFDDGWKNHYTRAFPILEKYNVKGTFYIISQMPQYMLEEGEGRMNTDELRELSKHGHEIGAHSRTHPYLQLSFPTKVKREVRGSKEDLEKLGFHIETFAYPYGRRNWFVNKMVANAGYSGARLAEGGTVTKKENKYSLPAKCLRNFTTFEEARSWIDEAAGKWLILVFHQIEPNPQSWGQQPELLEAICNYISEQKLETVTIAEGIKKYFN